MTCLGDLAKLIRSKNAGPFILTFDIMFDDEASYRRVIGAGVITKEAFARLYSVPVDDITLVFRSTHGDTGESFFIGGINNVQTGPVNRIRPFAIDIKLVISHCHFITPDYRYL